MKILSYILTALEILAGLVFLVNAASDIQLGFGAVLLAMGLNRIF